MKKMFFIFLLIPTLAFAVEPVEMLSDPTLETRARSITENLRCVVCQSQSIDESNADLARDLRIVVRERIMAGDSDQEVIDFVTARYGDYVLLKPPVKGTTAILWVGPFLALLFASGFVLAFFKKKKS